MELEYLHWIELHVRPSTRLKIGGCSSFPNVFFEYNQTPMISFDPVWPFTWFYRFLWPTVGSQNEFEPKPKVSSSSFVNRRHSPNLQIWWLKFLNLIPHGFLTDIGISFSWISRFGTKCRFFGILCNFSVYFGKALWWTTVILVKIL